MSLASLLVGLSEAIERRFTYKVARRAIVTARILPWGSPLRALGANFEGETTYHTQKHNETTQEPHTSPLYKIPSSNAHLRNILELLESGTAYGVAFLMNDHAFPPKRG